MEYSDHEVEGDGVDQYLRTAGRHELLSREEESTLFQAMEAGDTGARERLVRCNLRFVIKTAMPFRGLGVPLADLIQEGTIGLLTAIDRFDWRRGYRFTTYAACWIRQEIQGCVRKNSCLVRIPIRKARLLGKINEVVRRLTALGGFEPKANEIAHELGLPTEKIEAALALRETMLSLDAEVSEDATPMGETLPDTVTPAPSARIEQVQTAKAVHAVLEFLSDRERQVICLRFGIGGPEVPLSLRGTSKKVGLSQEGVRRIEQRAMGKLRRPTLCQRALGRMIA